mmetsp:Transcript_12804/g.19388  ORF Transcript_12804/g.19388 Transcript_12804/m.19388 type:complete len:111 (+) Transcript_12804:1-333(+)
MSTERKVIFEFPQFENSAQLFSTGTEYTIFGIDTASPVFQIGPYVFHGHYEYIDGTHLLFEENKTIPSPNPSPSPSDPLETQSQYVYHSDAHKKVVFLLSKVVKEKQNAT